jgi:predicted N-acetyltransferase YhbS
MSVTLRQATPIDAAIAGDICYRAFKAIAEAHGFPPDMPSADAAIGLVSSLIGHPNAFAVVAEIDGRIVGSNFLHEGDAIASVGPITVDPSYQNGAVGRQLMEAALERAVEKAAAGVRLVQAGYHRRSLVLYAKLGFEVKEHLSCLQGPAIHKAVPGRTVRDATTDDLDACNGLCNQIHGYHRGAELANAVSQGVAQLVEHEGKITGYAAPVAFFGHAVARTNDDLKALIGAAASFPGPGFLLPSRNGEMLRWCLGEGLRMVQPMTLMAKGAYREPQGAWLPSILY